jgi:hypothetical protein
MASTYYPPEEHEHPEGEKPHKECPKCDLKALDDLKCVAEGVKAQADYNESVRAKLEERRTQFNGARDAYSAARAGARDDLRDIRDKLYRVRDHLRRCLPEDVLKCLDDAWEKVRKRLEYCGMPTGCCIDDDCVFDTSYDDKVPTDDLLKRKAEYERRVKAAEDCFELLIKEPAELKDRVAKLKADVEALSKDPNTDPRASYAKVLWYLRRLEDIWLGFEDASEYHDCLCQALMCLVKGHQAIGVLVGEIAVRDCRDRWKKARCDWLKAHVWEEILAYCQKDTSPKPSYGEGEEPQRQSMA